MNKSYRVIFNHATGVYQCVSEFAKAKGKSKSVKALTVAVGMLMGGTSFAVTHTDGQVHTHTGNLAINGTALIANHPTELKSTGTIELGTTTSTNAQINNKGKLTANDDIILGSEFATTMTIDNGTVSTQKSIILSPNTAPSTLLIKNPDADLYAPTAIIGDKGAGTLETKNSATIDADGIKWFSRTSHIDTLVLGKDETGVGTLLIEDGGADIGKLIVGDKGVGKVNIGNYGFLTIRDNIERSATAKVSEIYLDGATLDFGNSQSNLFKGFDQNNKIELGANGVYFVIENINTAPLTVTINPNAVITGNAGAFSPAFLSNGEFKEFVGGFAKNGSGTLEISESSKKFTGDLGVAGGVLKINGNYTMNGENLAVIFLDDDEDGAINTTNEYGKLAVTGTADIGNGHLKVFTDKAIKDTPKDSVWRDVVTAGTLNGRFASVSDNSPLVDFYANYDDANRVHLQLTPPTTTTTPTPSTPVPTPSTPVPTPTIVNTFETAVKQNNNQSTLNLATVLDGVIADRIVGTNSDSTALANALIGTITTTNGFDDAKISQAVSELQPLLAGNVSQILTDTSQTVLQMADLRLANFDRLQSFWATASTSHSKKPIGDGNLMGYSTTTHLVVAGTDMPFDKGNVGIAIAGGHISADSDNHTANHQATVRQLQAMVYGDYAKDDRLSGFGQVAIGKAMIKGERHLSRLGAGIATSDYDATTLNAGLGVRYRIGDDTKHFTPFAKMEYDMVRADDYSETGAGVYNLNTHGKTEHRLQSMLGVNFTNSLTPTLALTGQLAGGIVHNDGDSKTTAHFDAMPSTAFDTIQTTGKGLGRAMLGLTYTPNPSTQLTLNYQGQWHKDHNSQGLGVSFKKSF